MLYKKAANANTWGVLEALMNIPGLSDFHLCGGTAIALLYRHRLSIDIDLFTTKVLDKHLLHNMLKSVFPSFRESFSTQKIFYFCYLDEVKTDFVQNDNPVISPFVTFDGIRMWGIKDIMAMKMSAVYGRGSKKDFWDIDILLDHYSIVELVDAFFEKYPHAFEEGIMLSLLYFDKADDELDPVKIKPRKWDDIKKRIEKEVYTSFRIRR